MIKKHSVFIKAVFVLYCILMLWLLFGQRADWYRQGAYFKQLIGNINLIPFKTVADYIRMVQYAESSYLQRHAGVNLVGNVIMFVPLGFFLPCIFKGLQSFVKHLLCVVLIIVCVEIIQLFTLLGSLDVDDLILNTAGSALGYCVYAFSAISEKTINKK